MKYRKYLDTKINSLDGKSIVVTGANSGLGFSIAKQTAYKGATVYLACRNEKRANEAINNIKSEISGASLKCLQYDQASFKSIDNFVNELSKIKSEINCLILNAGIFKPQKDLKTEDGFPLTCGTNYLGAFYLITKLNNLIKENKIKQIIIVSSFARLFSPKNYLSYLENDKGKTGRAYFASKRMNFELGIYLKSKYPDLPIAIIHPGIAKTRIVSNELNSFSKFIIGIGKLVLALIANDSDKSSLTALKALNGGENSAYVPYYYPRRIFHTAGYPACKKIKVNKKKINQLIDYSNKLIESAK